jgi:cohesin complex subunit SA-1/2
MIIFCDLTFQNFKAVMDLISDAFFKHSERATLRSCIKAIVFCSIEGTADLQDYAQNKINDLESELVSKLKNAIKEVEVYSEIPAFFLLYYS